MSSLKTKRMSYLNKIIEINNLININNDTIFNSPKHVNIELPNNINFNLNNNKSPNK
jgi:hypothetical protein